jgi:hypothetical protein
VDVVFLNTVCTAATTVAVTIPVTVVVANEAVTWHNCRSPDVLQKGADESLVAGVMGQ